MTHQHSRGVVGLTVRTEEIPMSPNQEPDEAGGSYIKGRYQLPGGESPGVSGRSLPRTSCEMAHTAAFETPPPGS